MTCVHQLANSGHLFKIRFMIFDKTNEDCDFLSVNYPSLNFVPGPGTKNNGGLAIVPRPGTKISQYTSINSTQLSIVRTDKDQQRRTSIGRPSFETKLV